MRKLKIPAIEFPPHGVLYNEVYFWYIFLYFSTGKFHGYPYRLKL